MEHIKSYKHFFALKDPIHEIIRVNHAGELGAKYIYLGQLKALKEDEEILLMLEGELEHLEFFDEEIKKQGVRPSILNPIWKKCAFFMGYLTAISSRQTAMLCTEKVETVISKHYGEQIEILKNGYLQEKIIKFREDELSHLRAGESSSSGNKFIGNVITFSTKMAIKLSKIF
jgi:ubiquinone biosynthesis monooxygenase Coq7